MVRKFVISGTGIVPAKIGCDDSVEKPKKVWVTTCSKYISEVLALTVGSARRTVVSQTQAITFKCA